MALIGSYTKQTVLFKLKSSKVLQNTASQIKESFIIFLFFTAIKIKGFLGLVTKNTDSKLISQAKY